LAFAFCSFLLLFFLLFFFLFFFCEMKYLNVSMLDYKFYCSSGDSNCTFNI
jgi:hypothetical protein